MAHHAQRLQEEIREEVARLIGKELKDPRIGFVTVTRVELTSDLRLARVNVGVLGGAEQQAKTLAGLKQASGFIRKQLGRRLRVRHTPELVFQYDRGLEATDRVAKLLDEVRPADDAEDAPEE